MNRAKLLVIRKAVKRLSTSSCEEVQEKEEDQCQTPKKKAKVTRTPTPAEVKEEKVSEGEGLASAPLDTLIACCEGCQQWVPGVLFGARKRRLKFYCAECRANRRELGRKLNYYKRFGCGECVGCTVVEDCGVCRGCVVRNSEPKKNWKCVKRRCQKLKEIKAEALCRNTAGKAKKEIKAEALCRNTAGKAKKKAKTQFPGMKKAMKKMKAESQVVEKKLPKKIKTELTIKTEEVEEEMAVQKPCPPIKEEKVQQPPIQLFTPVPVFVSEDFVYYYNVNSEFLLKNSRSRRNNRSCGECEACLRPMDCGTCDFCKDKAKFGGSNTLRQKCRWKQCLRFASKRLLPRELLGQSQWLDWKEPGYRNGRRRWKENAFASRKVARVIQAARKRKIWQSSAQAAEAGADGRSEPGEKAEENGVPPAEAAEASRALTESPESRQETAEEKVGSSPTEGSAAEESSPPRSPEIKSAAPEQAFNLKKFLSVMKPFLKGPSSSEAHDRPSVIRETSEWQLSSSSEQARRQPVEATALPSQVATKQDVPEQEPDRIPSTAGTISEPDQASHRSVSPAIKQDSRKNHTSRKAVPLTTEEADLNEVSPRIVSPVIKEECTEPASAYRQPISPKRPAEPEVRSSGIPSNSRITRRETPEQNPGYGRSAPAAGEAGQSVPSQSLEGSKGDADDDSGLPVITQIFSLGSPYMMMTLEPHLRNFMQDLMVMPLPASWVVCSSLGPDVQLIQLSRKSPVSDAVVQIRPGFFFHVLVRGLPVPLGHRLYRSHPAQLTTVDDVVDLIGDLETYRVCAGYPQLRNCKPPPAVVAALLPRERSSYCEVLVVRDRCFQCAVTL
ncbi:methyl-CpG-binding domain protein 1a [Heptranchias perlo]|uniref:methyl-CpG-binding domain protein 1a n=1 Tax=Heptranchias perlo TaxID=212740 RepID=UPI00355973FA